MNRRLTALQAFLRVELPPAPARVLEIGCGEGELASALAEDGYRVVAIDPDAPHGSIFRSIALEDFSTADGFDAVVASVSLHHVDDLELALDKVAGLLLPAGILVLEEFAKERLAGPTAGWYYHQRRAAAAVGRSESAVAHDFETWQRELTDNLADVHPFADVRRSLEGRFVERHFAWTPYLYSYLLDDALEPVERELIESGEIAATGVRYVGVARAR